MCLLGKDTSCFTNKKVIGEGYKMEGFMTKKGVISLILAFVMALSVFTANFTTMEAQAASQTNRVVGYFPAYRMYTVDSIDFSAMTHCMLAFMTYSNGTLTSNFTDAEVRNVVAKCHANGTKAMIAIGGWNGFDSGDNPFGTPAKRTAFVNQVMNYVNTYNLDGVDIDIELEDANIWNNFDALISELSGRLKNEGKLLTMAVSKWFTGSIANSTYQYFDFLNLMSYDYNQSGTDEVAPWSQIYDMINYYSSKGVSNDKLVIGVPFYGYGPGGTAYTYSQMVAMDPANAHRDYANGVYYNGMDTIRAKAEYSKAYGGTMIWEIGQDTYDSTSLLQVIKEVMKQNAPVNPPSQGTTGSTTTASGDIYIYQDINYGGTAASLGPGNYNLASLQAKGFKNDDLSSIKCPWGYKVTLYADDNFSGASKVITADTSWIGSDWNDRVTSIKVEKARYRIVNRHSGLCLDVSGANTANGTNIQQWTSNGTAAQIWEVNFNAEDSTYVLTSTIHGKALDMDGFPMENGGNAHIWDNGNTANQRWYITFIDNGYTFLINKHSNKCLEVSGWSTTDGGNVQQWDYFAQANQQWKFEMVN